MEKTYANYLKVPELLALQQPCSEGPEHDETLFIVIHQVYELWFKQQLHEVEHLAKALLDSDIEVAMTTLKRMLTILKTMVAQVDILETMTPVSFLSFRAFLDNASGFQSAQFREFEFMLGHKRQRPVENYPEGSPERMALQARLAQPSIWHCLLRLLKDRGITIPKDVLDRAVEEPTASSEAVQIELIKIYHHDPLLRSLCELFVDLDEGIQEWRYRHVKMVERTIGMKVGTGGSPGAAYLRNTLFQPLFPDLWEIRSEL